MSSPACNTFEDSMVPHYRPVAVYLNISSELRV